MTSTAPFPSVPSRRILNTHFISQILSEPVKEFSISAGSKHGDNVMGKLLSVDVKTESNEIHNLILKSILPMTGIIDKNTLIDGEYMAGWHAFPVEICYYTEILPIFQQVAKDRPRFTLFSRPKYYSSYCNAENGLHDYIVMEDLRPSGYKMVDKYKGLNLEQAMATLKQLATFNAVSYCLLNGKSANKALCAKRNDKKSYLNYNNWDKRAHPFADHELLYNGLLSGMIDIVRNDMGMVDVAARMEEEFATKGYQTMLDLSERTGKEEKYFPVLIHGDLWTNNILFKLAPDGRSVEDVKFIDFQQVRFGNIYEDLHYFIFTSTTAEFRQKHLTSCLRLYFDEFAKVVTEIGGCALPKGFSEEEIVATFKENMNFGCGNNLMTIPYQFGIPPLPSSPMTPTELELPNEGTNGNDEDVFFQVEQEKIDFDKISAEQKVAMIEGIRNSPVGQTRLRELVAEMIEHNII